MSLREDVLRFLFIEIGYADQKLHGKRLRPLRMQLHVRGHRDAFVGVARFFRDVFHRTIETCSPRGTEKMLRSQSLGIGRGGRLEMQIKSLLRRFNGAGATALGNGFSNGWK